MKSQSPTLAEILAQAIENAQSRVWTALPGRVASFDHETQTVSVQPTVANIYYDENEERVAERLPTIPDVPVLFPGAGDYSITWPLAKGDIVLLIFTSCSLDRWIVGDGRDVDPGDDRRNDLTDAIAIPGLRPQKRALANASTDGITIAADLIKLGADDASDPIARKSDLAALRADIINHKHSGVTTGSGISGPVDPSTTIDTPACSPVVRSK